MKADTNPKTIAQTQEAPSPLPWYGVSCTLGNPDGTTSEGVMLARVREGKTIETSGEDDLIEVAMFQRPADARRVLACLHKFNGVSTEEIEMMPLTVAQMASQLSTTSFIVSSLYEAAESEEVWAEFRNEVIASKNAPRPLVN